MNTITYLCICVATFESSAMLLLTLADREHLPTNTQCLSSCRHFCSISACTDAGALFIPSGTASSTTLRSIRLTRSGRMEQCSHLSVKPAPCSLPIVQQRGPGAVIAAYPYSITIPSYDSNTAHSIIRDAVVTCVTIQATLAVRIIHLHHKRQDGEVVMCASTAS